MRVRRWRLVDRDETLVDVIPFFSPKLPGEVLFEGRCQHLMFLAIWKRVLLMDLYWSRWYSFYSWHFARKPCNNLQLCFNFFRASLGFFSKSLSVIAWTGSSRIYYHILELVWCSGATYYLARRTALSCKPSDTTSPPTTLCLIRSEVCMLGDPSCNAFTAEHTKIALYCPRLRNSFLMGFWWFLHLPVDAEIGLSSPILFVSSYAFLIFAGAHKQIRVEFKSRR